MFNKTLRKNIPDPQQSWLLRHIVITYARLYFHNCKTNIHEHLCKNDWRIFEALKDGKLRKIGLVSPPNHSLSTLCGTHVCIGKLHLTLLKDMRLHIIQMGFAKILTVLQRRKYGIIQGKIKSLPLGRCHPYSKRGKDSVPLIGQKPLVEDFRRNMIGVWHVQKESSVIMAIVIFS